MYSIGPLSDCFFGKSEGDIWDCESLQEEKNEGGLVTGLVEPLPHLPPAPLSVATSRQFHAQDELGNHEYGYSNANSAKHEVGPH